MAESKDSKREPEEGTWDEFGEENSSTVNMLRSQELSLPLSLKAPGSSDAKALHRGTSDEGLPMSPVTPEAATPRADLMADIKKLEERMESILGILASWADVTEGTRFEQRRMSERFEEMKCEGIDLKKRYRELAYMVDRLEDRQKMEEEKQKEIADRVAEVVDVRVKEEMDRRKIEFLCEMEDKMKAMIIEEQSKREERELQLHVRNQRFSEQMAEKRVAEVKQAMLEAHKERDAVKRRFQVTMVKLQEEEDKNACLLQKIQELECRCQHLEEENARLRLSDIVHQTSFTFEGPMLECFSCREEYSTHHNDPEGCRFHPIPCMPYETWRNCISTDELPADFTVSQGRSFHFWACCNVLARRRPEGCCHGRHHQQWEMDIMMRQALVEGSEHSAFTEPLRVQ